MMLPTIFSSQYKGVKKFTKISIFIIILPTKLGSNIYSIGSSQIINCSHLLNMLYILQVIEITGTILLWMPSRTFAGLPALEELDLRNNSLSRIEPNELIGITSLKNVYLSGL